ncbi:MAG TPA: response regulator [bacterium]|jgi:DNA-binding NtrC family response regulator
MTRRKRILYIEDDATVRAEIGMLLEILGYEVTFAGDAPEARKRFHEKPVDLVLTDLYMPGGLGTELLKEFHHAQPDLPVIVLTGFPSDETIRQTILSGGYTYLAKPVSGDQLRDVIEHALSEKG